MCVSLSLSGPLKPNRMTCMLQGSVKFSCSSAAVLMLSELKKKRFQQILFELSWLDGARPGVDKWQNYVLISKQADLKCT